MNRIVNTRFASRIHGASLRMLVLLSALLVGAGAALAQTTAFTYQGRLTDGGNPANGSYDLQVRLFDAATGGNQIGATNSINGITVTGGVFTATLDFGAAAFPGANRWAEISARPAGNGSLTTLNPRQPVTSTPYAIKSLSAGAADSLSASCNGCVTGAQIGSLPASSGNYIQNSTAQQTANLNISGDARVGSLFGTFVSAEQTVVVDRGGVNDGTTNFGLFPGIVFGAFPVASGEGIASKRTNGGNGFGLDFFTSYKSRLSIANNGNVGIGTATPGDRLEIGAFSDPADNYLTIKTAGGNQRRGGIKFRVFANDLGFTIENDERAVSNGLNILRHTFNEQTQVPVTFSALFIDKQNGNVGIGTVSPSAKFSVRQGANLAAVETSDGNVSLVTQIDGSGATATGVVGTNTNHVLTFKVANTHVVNLGINAGVGEFKPVVDGTVRLGTATNRFTSVFAINGTIQTSDARLKKGVTNLNYGLRDLMRLRPVSFAWKDSTDARTHLGFIAQEVEQVIPEAIERGKEDATPLGMNYTSLVPVLIKAVQEQQATIECKDTELKVLNTRLEALEQMMQQLTGQQVKQPKQR